MPTPANVLMLLLWIATTAGVLWVCGGTFSYKIKRIRQPASDGSLPVASEGDVIVDRSMEASFRSFGSSRSVVCCENVPSESVALLIDASPSTDETVEPADGNEASKPWSRTQYSGQIVDGKRHGEGTQIYKDTSVYEGQFLKNKRSGKGKMTSADGLTYEGDWEKDQPHGQGIEAGPDGTSFEGTFENGLRHGRGRQTSADGSWIEGVWEKGLVVSVEKRS